MFRTCLEYILLLRIQLRGGGWFRIQFCMSQQALDSMACHDILIGSFLLQVSVLHTNNVIPLNIPFVVATARESWLKVSILGSKWFLTSCRSCALASVIVLIADVESNVTLTFPIIISQIRCILFENLELSRKYLSTSPPVELIFNIMDYLMPLLHSNIEAIT